MTAPKLIFPCSGASEAGLLADRAARQMTADGTGKMFCLAGIGGRVENILVNARAAGKILVIDGCPQECARKTMELAGSNGFAHLQLQRDLGLKRGSIKATDACVRQVADRGAMLLEEGATETGQTTAFQPLCR